MIDPIKLRESVNDSESSPDAVEVCGRTVTAHDILHGYRGKCEIMDHDEREGMGDAEYDDIKKRIQNLRVTEEDMPQEMLDDGYSPDDIEFVCDSTDSGIDAQVWWDRTNENRDASNRESNRAED